MSLVSTRWAQAALHTSHVLIVLPADQALIANEASSSSSSSSGPILTPVVGGGIMKEFIDLTSAVAYAEIGDTIYMKPGHHWVTSDLIIEKAIRIIGQDLSSSSYSALASSLEQQSGSSSSIDLLCRGIIGSCKKNASTDPSRYVIELNATVHWKASFGYICGLSFRRPKPIPGVITHCFCISKDDEEENEMVLQNNMDNDTNTSTVTTTSTMDSVASGGGSKSSRLDPKVGCLLIHCHVSNQGAQGACVLIDNGAVAAFYNCSISNATTSGMCVRVSMHSVLSISRSLIVNNLIVDSILWLILMTYISFFFLM